MNTVQTLLSLLSVIGLTDAVYKHWIPNTNFENSSNWYEQRVPCSQDKVIFPKDKKVSIFVQSTHSLTDLHMPLDGEFILSHGAGFVSAWTEDPACGQGSLINFHDPDRYQWFDPTLWQSALSTDDLEKGRFLFAVDAERVPCRYDDVVFSPETSFRVQIKETGSEIQLRSISVLGRITISINCLLDSFHVVISNLSVMSRYYLRRLVVSQRFTNNEEFAQYIGTHTGTLQFPGPALPQITNMKCQDHTGCVCRNHRTFPEICSALLQHTENKCPAVSCTNPLHPAGHCCGVCGAIISLEYTSGFDLDTYRSRLIHTFLSLGKYSAVKLAISKVEMTPSVLRLIPLGSEEKIQIVIIDQKEGSLSGTDAQQLGYDVMSDIEKHGQSFGITKCEMQLATGITTSAQKGTMSAGAIFGIVLSIVLAVSLMGVTYFLYRIDVCRLHYFRLFSYWRNAPMEEMSPEEWRGFDNPIFEPAAENIQITPTSHTGEDDLNGVSVEKSGFQFSNPVYNPDVDV